MEDTYSNNINFDDDMSLSEEEEEEDYDDNDDNIFYNDPNQFFLNYLQQTSFPPLPSVNNEWFNSELTKETFKYIYGPSYMLSNVLRYVYKKYPMIHSIKVLEEKNLISLKKQLELQGNQEFSINYRITCEFIDKICESGCFPLGNQLEGVENILVKLHNDRCVLEDIKKNLHVSRTIKKISKRYMITINGDYYNCVKEIHKYHKNSWLFPQITECFEELYNENRKTIKDKSYENKYKTKIYSFELWNITQLNKLPETIEELKNNAKLVAGEIGYSNGGSYTSLTGYHSEKSSGTVQLVATGKLLELNGFKIWDFGMSMDYKLKLGAKNIPREEFLTSFYNAKTYTPTIFPDKPILVSSLL